MGILSDQVLELEERCMALEGTINDSDVSIAALERKLYKRTEIDVRDYLTNTLHKVLCDRYNISYHTTKQKLVDLVIEELNI